MSYIRMLAIIAKWIMVTVNKALRRGQFIINVPVFLIMFSVLGLCIVLTANKSAPGYVILLGIV